MRLSYAGAARSQSRTRSPGLGGAPAQLTNAGGTIHYSMFGSVRDLDGRSRSGLTAIEAIGAILE
jgi:hypothetical protein